ncbi:MAG: hypothetical protein WAO98_10465 [Alphaproteobacteria bacterium]
MSRLDRISFSRNLKGYLGSSWISRSLSANGVGRTSKSLSVDPINAVDAIYETVSDRYESPDHLNGFQNVTRQLLANDVLTSLIQLQNDMNKFDDELQPYEPDLHSAEAAKAYRTTDANLSSAARF